MKALIRQKQLIGLVNELRNINTTYKHSRKRNSSSEKRGVRHVG